MPIVSKTTVRLYPPDVEIINAWAAANPDPDTGLTPSRPTAIRRSIVPRPPRTPLLHCNETTHKVDAL